MREVQASWCPPASSLRPLLLAPATCRTAIRSVTREVRNQAQEFQRCAARVLELVLCAARHEDGRSRFQETLLVAFHDDSVTLQNVDFMFVRVAMQGRVSPRHDFEMTHGERGGPVRIVDQAANLAAGSTGHINGRRFNLIVGDDLHEKIPRVMCFDAAAADSRDFVAELPIIRHLEPVSARKKTSR